MRPVVTTWSRDVVSQGGRKPGRVAKSLAAASEAVAIMGWLPACGSQQPRWLIFLRRDSAHEKSFDLFAVV